MVALSLVAWAISGAPVALAQQQARATIGERADAVAAHGRERGRARCVSLADGRGERVVMQATGGTVESTFAKDCPPAGAQSRPGDVTTSPRHVDSKRQVGVAEPDLAVRGLAAGLVQSSVADDDEETVPLAVRVTAGRLSATLLTGGTAIWLLHSAFWTYLLVLGLPIWRHVDLLPIVDSAPDHRATEEAAAPDAEEERAVAQLLEARPAADAHTEERH
jgi:hypothetical protein